MTAKFGTSGLRGLAEDLIGAPSVDHVRAFVRHLKTKRLMKAGDAVGVAHDFRASSAALHENVSQALAAEGMAEIFYGAVPTPALAFEAMRKKRASIMITGSHIPADRNGIKFYRPDGEISKADEQAIVAGVAKLKPAKAGKISKKEGTPEKFVARYVSAFANKPLKGMRVGVYQHSTVARDMLVSLLEKAGAEAVALARSDVFIPVDTEAVSNETLALIKGWCAGGRFDAIVSADGDGDRPLVADEKGQVLRGDLVGLITARFLKAQTVVTPITSNSGLDAHMKKPAIRSKVGSPFVIDEMLKAKKRAAKAIVGFEANGGFFTLSNFKLGNGTFTALPTRDCFLPILAILAAARKAKRPVSGFAAGFALPVALADRLENFPLTSSQSLMSRLQDNAALADFFGPFGTMAKVDRLDGLRVMLNDSSIIHLRPSGNAPEFRVYVEAKTQNEAEKLLKAALARIASAR
ncbi:phosphomannomutase [Aestuariivirga litoralis]|uniref:phosphomannomutase n=1 Tax=Aestuariivirga litoralis TaxID=2650924 RepID=UPI0018C53D43|nr:phosphomannomutase [Aestuariivirga litoralis]MBG1233580.1 phosphomannomutase [Aestuariivirga litoralis]